MNQNYRIPESKWWLFLPILLLLLLMLIQTTLWRYNDFQDHPSLKTGWILFSWILLWIFWLYLPFREFMTARVVSVCGDEIWVQSVSFSQLCSDEIVTSVTEDPITFHLYSRTDKVTISKKRVPIELAQFLSGRIRADKEMNKPTLASTILSRID